MNALPVLMLTQDATLWQEWQQIAGPQWMPARGQSLQRSGGVEGIHARHDRHGRRGWSRWAPARGCYTVRPSPRAALARPVGRLGHGLAALGRWSLSYYMLHQLVLIGALVAWMHGLR